VTPSDFDAVILGSPFEALGQARKQQISRAS
jgi:hypothetical protein